VAYTIQTEHNLNLIVKASNPLPRIASDNPLLTTEVANPNFATMHKILYQESFSKQTENSTTL